MAKTSMKIKQFVDVRTPSSENMEFAEYVSVNWLTRDRSPA